MTDEQLLDTYMNQADLANAARLKAENEAKQAGEELASDLKWVMGTNQGRRFVMRLFERARIYGTTYDPTSDRNSAFNEGMRNAGLMLLADIHAAGAYGSYTKMLMEDHEAKQLKELKEKENG
jgi:hypothetical protein